MKKTQLFLLVSALISNTAFSGDNNGIVINQDTWKNQLQDARSLLKQWFPEEDDFSQSENDKPKASSSNE